MFSLTTFSFWFAHKTSIIIIVLNSNLIAYVWTKFSIVNYVEIFFYINLFIYLTQKIVIFYRQ